MPLEKIVAAGARVTEHDDGFTVTMDSRPDPVDIVTLPYPGFPTDLQPQFIAMNAISDGTALITENLFEARFRFTQELGRLGAEVRTDGHHAWVRGKPALSGAPVESTDIRAGAALVLAALVAQGESVIHGVDHIDRGYVRMDEVLKSLGADVERVAN
jgi:UDP-N-acetylglucosamine 1-carboxyvinyltransferase